MSSAEIDRIWVVAVTVFDKNANETLTKYYATGDGFTTKPSDTPANTHVAPRVIQALDITRSLFGMRTTRGRSTLNFGDVVLNNADGALEDGTLGEFMDWVVDGQPITVYSGPSDFEAFPDDFTVRFVGTMQDAEVTRERVNLKLRDRQAELDIPLQTEKYAGDNENGQGVEGTDDIAGKPKPIVYGSVFNITPTLVNPGKLIYQVADRQMSSVVVRDVGIRLTNSYDDWASVSPGILFGLSAAAVFAFSYGGGVMIAAGTGGLLKTASLGGTFTTRTDNFGGNDIYGLAWGDPYGTPDGVHVAVGEGGTLTCSLDGGITWLSRTSGFGSDHIRAVAYASIGPRRFFVAVGDAGKISTSPDGLTWTAETSGVATALNGVAANSQSVVVVGDAGVILVSTEGTTWAAGTSGTSNDLYGVTWGETGGWVACGESATVVSSRNVGALWSVRTTTATGTYRAAHYGNGYYMVAGDTDSGTAVSRDGEKWSRATRFAGIGVTLVFATRAILFAEDFFYRAGNDSLGFGALWRVTDTGTYASLSEMENDALAPSEGGYKVLTTSTGTYFRLGAQSDGIVTADVIEKASDADMTAAQIWKRILEDRGGMTSGDYSASDLTTLDGQSSAVVGFFADNEASVRNALDDVAGSLGAAWYSDLAGDFRIKQFRKPSGNPVATFKANNLVRPLARVQSSDQGGGLPVYQSLVRWGRNYTPTPDLAAAVSAERRALLLAPWREASAANDSVREVHPLSQQYGDESGLTTETDAQAEATRRLALREERPDFFEVVVKLTDANLAIDVNDVIELLHDRYGLSLVGDEEFGGKFRVIEASPDAQNETLSLVVWGRRPFNRVTSTGAYRTTSTGAYRRVA